MTQIIFDAHMGAESESIKALPTAAEQVINQEASAPMDAPQQKQTFVPSLEVMTPLAFDPLKKCVYWGTDMERWTCLKKALLWQPLSTIFPKWWQLESPNLSFTQLQYHAIIVMANALKSGCFPRNGKYALLPLGLGDLSSANSLYLSVTKSGGRWFAGKMSLQSSHFEEAFPSPLQHWNGSAKEFLPQAYLYVDNGDILRYCELEEIQSFRGALFSDWYATKNNPSRALPCWEWTMQEHAWQIPVGMAGYSHMVVSYNPYRSQLRNHPCYRFVKLV